MAAPLCWMFDKPNASIHKEQTPNIQVSSLRLCYSLARTLLIVYLCLILKLAQVSFVSTLSQYRELITIVLCLSRPLLKSLPFNVVQNHNQGLYRLSGVSNCLHSSKETVMTTVWQRHPYYGLE